MVETKPKKGNGGRRKAAPSAAPSPGSYAAAELAGAAAEATDIYVTVTVEHPKHRAFGRARIGGHYIRAENVDTCTLYAAAARLRDAAAAAFAYGALFDNGSCQGLRFFIERHHARGGLGKITERLVVGRDGTTVCPDTASFEATLYDVLEGALTAEVLRDRRQEMEARAREAARRRDAALAAEERGAANGS